MDQEFERILARKQRESRVKCDLSHRKNLGSFVRKPHIDGFSEVLENCAVLSDLAYNVEKEASCVSASSKLGTCNLNCCGYEILGLVQLKVVYFGSEFQICYGFARCHGIRHSQLGIWRRSKRRNL